MKYERPDLEIIMTAEEDVIRTSNPTISVDTGRFGSLF